MYLLVCSFSSKQKKVYGKDWAVHQARLHELFIWTRPNSFFTCTHYFGVGLVVWYCMRVASHITRAEGKHSAFVQKFCLSSYLLVIHINTLIWFKTLKPHVSSVSTFLTRTVRRNHDDVSPSPELSCQMCNDVNSPSDSRTGMMKCKVLPRTKAWSNSNGILSWPFTYFDIWLKGFIQRFAVTKHL